MKQVIFLLFFLVAANAQAQNGIFIEEEDGIRNMMDTRKELNFKKDRYIKAWSIQLLVTRDKYLAIEKREAFLKEFKEFKADWVYEQPYYKLNVGAYYTKLEATMAMNKLLEKYPDAYVFKNGQVKASDF